MVGQSEAILQKFKQQTFRMKPYEMHIVDGRPGECPQMSNVVLIKGEEGQPVSQHLFVSLSLSLSLGMEVLARINRQTLALPLVAPWIRPHRPGLIAT